MRTVPAGWAWPLPPDVMRRNAPNGFRPPANPSYNLKCFRAPGHIGNVGHPTNKYDTRLEANCRTFVRTNRKRTRLRRALPPRGGCCRFVGSDRPPRRVRPMPSLGLVR
ncbi:unnamed protein product, partial [Ectocarpus sp. 13 AM-2016]